MPLPFDLYGIPDVDETLVQPPPQGDFVRGAKIAIGQTMPILKGVVGLGGATAEQALGEGGLATGIKNWGLKGYQEGMQALAPNQKDTDDLTVAWDKATKGDLGALVDWVQYGLGYAVGQGGEAAASALIGAGAGAVLAPEAAPVSAPGGAVVGLVAKGAVRQRAVALIEKAVSKEANNLMAQAAQSGSTLAAQDAVRMATASIAKEIGSTGALLGYSGAQELGSIYPEAEAEAAKKGEQLTGADLARVWGTGLLAGGIEGLTDKLGIEAAMGRVRIPGATSRLGQAGLQGVAGAGIEAGTEAAQTVLERVGANQPVADPEGLRDIINSAGLGAVGGAAIGGAAGALRGPRERSNEAFTRIAGATNVDDAIKAFEDTYIPPVVPQGFDSVGALTRLERQRQQDEKALRQYGPVASDAVNVSREAGPTPPGVEATQPVASATVTEVEPFNDRLITLREQVASSRVRQQVRDELGPEALNDILYYSQKADDASLPGKTSDRMLAVAEAILQRAGVQPITSTPKVGPRKTGAALGQPEAVPLLPLDTAPTGRIRVGADGVAVQEIEADRIQAADRERAARAPDGMTGSFPQGAPNRPGVLVGEGTFATQTSPTNGPVLALPGPKSAETVDNEAHQAAASPTNDKTASKEQILAGNAELGHTNVSGLDLSIENPAGTERVDLKHEPPKWRTQMRDHYGYIRGTTSIDGEHVDVFVKNGTAKDWAGAVYVVDQVVPSTGKPDEHKVMLGYGSVEEAKAAYLAHYAPGWKGMKAISALPFDTFKRWVYSPELTAKPMVAQPNPQDVIANDGLRLGDARQNIKPLREGTQQTDEGDAGRTELAALARELAKSPLLDLKERAYLTAVANNMAKEPDGTLAQTRESLDRWKERIEERRTVDAEPFRVSADVRSVLEKHGMTPADRLNDEKWSGPDLGLGDVFVDFAPDGEATITAQYFGRDQDVRRARGAAAIDAAIQRAIDGVQAGRKKLAQERMADEGLTTAAKPTLPTPQGAPNAADQVVKPEGRRPEHPEGAGRGQAPQAGGGDRAGNAAPREPGGQGDRQPQGTQRQEAQAVPASPVASAYARFDGVEVKMPLEIEGGQKGTLTIDAGKALRALEQRSADLTKLAACLKGSA